MEQLILKPAIIETIKEDQILYGKVAAALDVNILSLNRILIRENNPVLTQITVLNVLREHLKVADYNELLTEMVAA